MRNIKLTTLLLAVGMFLLSSCEKQLDINTDPLVATSADPNVVLPYVIVQYSNRFITELGTRIMDVPQHFAFCFNSPRNGATTIFFDRKYLGYVLYTGAGKFGTGRSRCLGSGRIKQ